MIMLIHIMELPNKVDINYDIIILFHVHIYEKKCARQTHLKLDI
jgi:hypothetical protein